ncbi:MAG: hypothetical protein M0R03_22855, partial [Novosphingobium sp.]|nr:hypothetical protein [Novosphingobium sp.]
SHLVPTSEIYNFIVSYNGEVLGTFNNYQVQCSNAPLGQCSITLNLAQATGTAPDFENYGDITQLFTLDNDAHILYHTFSSTDGETKKITSLVLKSDGYGNTTICNNSATGTSGTITCSIPPVYQNSTFIVQTFAEGDLIGSKFFSQGVDQEWYGVDTIIILLAFSSFVLLFIGHPITIVIGAIIGLLFPVILVSIAGLSFTTIIGSLLYWIAGGIVIMIVIRKKM